LSHELDYLQWIFGDVIGLFARGGRFGEITQDSDDAWNIVFETKLVPLISLHLNYFSKPGIRKIWVTTEESTYVVDLNSNSIYINGELAFSSIINRDNQFQEMHADMLNEREIICTLEESTQTDKLIANIELSSNRNVWINT
jgi:predicted dehydrogenase